MFPKARIIPQLKCRPQCHTPLLRQPHHPGLSLLLHKPEDLLARQENLSGTLTMTLTISYNNVPVNILLLIVFLVFKLLKVVLVKLTR